MIHSKNKPVPSPITWQYTGRYINGLPEVVPTNQSAAKKKKNKTLLLPIYQICPPFITYSEKRVSKEKKVTSNKAKDKTASSAETKKYNHTPKSNSSRLSVSSTSSTPSYTSSRLQDVYSQSVTPTQTKLENKVYRTMGLIDQARVSQNASNVIRALQNAKQLMLTLSCLPADLG